MLLTFHLPSLSSSFTIGYFCKSNAPSATPDRNVSLPFYNESLIETMYYLKSLDYGQCPPNHYCVNGTTDPVQCDNGTVYQYTHASAKDNCGPCPAGTYCVSGAPTPRTLPLGYYCPFGSVDPLPCPRETYGAQVGYSSAGECVRHVRRATVVTVPVSSTTPYGHVLQVIIVPMSLRLLLVALVVLICLPRELLMLPSVSNVPCIITALLAPVAFNPVLLDLIVT